MIAEARALCLAVATSLLSLLPVSAQELRGHGGPVRSLSLSADGALALSGSFDTSAIVWDIKDARAISVLRGHDGPVNATQLLPDGRFVTGGEDGRLLIWTPGREAPDSIFPDQRASISDIALSADARRLAVAAWDGSVSIVTLAPRNLARLDAHQGPVSAVAFTARGEIASGGHDGTIRLSPGEGGSPLILRTGQPVSALAVLPDGGLVAGGNDGRLRFFSPDRSPAGEIQIGETPIVALALSPDGLRLAAAGIRGSVALVGLPGRAVERVLVGPGLPVWSLAFRPGTDELLTGGGDRLIRRWRASTGEHLGAVVMARPSDAATRLADHPGAEVFRACSACHTLGPDDGNRAGPTLHGVIGRRIGTAPGYEYSPALRGMDLVWTKERIAELFEIGPNAYTPGTKMPEQRVVDPDDRKALVDFIAKATGAE